MAFATVSDLKLGRQESLPEHVSDDALTAKLEEASAWLSINYSIPSAPSEAQRILLRSITCNLAFRSITASSDDTQSRSETYGQFKYQESYFDRGGGQMWLSSQEKDSLETAFPRGKRYGSMEV